MVVRNSACQNRVGDRQVIAVTARFTRRTCGVTRLTNNRRRRRAGNNRIGQCLCSLAGCNTRLFVLRHEQADIAGPHRRDREQRNGNKEHQRNHENRATLFMSR